MATLQRKKVNGNYYWYIVESRRVNGKPRPVVLAYLGKAEDLLQRLSAKAPFQIRSTSHGSVAALLNLSRELGVVEIIDRHATHTSTGKPPTRDGLSVGESLLLAAIGRACKPTSKMAWYEWCKDTSLEYLLKKNLKKLDSQHFWDQMHTIPAQSIPKIEGDIVAALAKIIPLSTDKLFFDTTNFFTFIDSSNTRCSIPKRGHNKQKRNDLRQFNLALVVTGTDHIPLFHHIYDGNKNDITAFKENLPHIVARFKALSLDFNRITLIFDKGNNSKENFSTIDTLGTHFVGSLSPAHFRSLIENANTQLQPIDVGGTEVLAFKTTHDVWGKLRTCVVFISQELLTGQVQGIYQSLGRITASLDKLQHRLLNTKHRYTKEKLQEVVSMLVDSQYVNVLLKVKVCCRSDSKLSLRYWVDLDEFDRLKQSVLGRQILVTSREVWSVEEIICGYQRKTKIEYAFRSLKDPDHLSLRPQYHWTDQKIAVHAFICVLALLLSTVAYARARKDAHYARDLSHFLDDLARIRLASVIHRSVSSKGRPKLSYTLELPHKNLNSLVKAFALAI